MARLGDSIKQIRGVSYKPEDLHPSLDGDSIMLLRANNIQDGKLFLGDVVYVDKAKVRPDQLLKKGDILICTSSGSKELVGKAAYVEEDTNITFGAFCKVVRPIANYPRYVGHFFNSKTYRDTISAISAGVNINNIRGEHIDELQINVPSLDEQKKIASKLDEIENLIFLRKKQLQKLDDLIKSRFVEMFEQGDYPEIEFGRICVFLRNGANIKQTKGAGIDAKILWVRLDTMGNDKRIQAKSLNEYVAIITSLNDAPIEVGCTQKKEAAR